MAICLLTRKLSCLQIVLHVLKPGYSVNNDHCIKDNRELL